MNDEEKAAVLAKLQFRGLVEIVAQQFGGTFGSHSNIIDEIVAEFALQPPKTNKKKWLAERIEPMFKYITKRPEWIYDPEWPYHQGQPMVFIDQVTVGDGPHRGLVTVDTVLYIFGALEPFEGAKRQVYTVVEQLKDFAFLKGR